MELRTKPSQRLGLTFYYHDDSALSELQEIAYPCLGFLSPLGGAIYNVVM